MDWIYDCNGDCLYTDLDNETITLDGPQNISILINHKNIIGLDCNAVVIYPKHTKLKDKNINDFIHKRKEANKG